MSNAATTIAVINFLNSAVTLYNDGHLSEEQLEQIWDAVSIKAAEAEQYWEQS